jgi:hypothetical protein
MMERCSRWRSTCFGTEKAAAGSLKHSLRAIVLGTVLAAALAGCGGNAKQAQLPASTAVTAPQKTVALSKSAYDATMRQLGRRLAISVEGLFPLVESQAGDDTTKASVAKVESTRAVATSVMTRVAAIAPPGPIRAEHRRLVKGLSDFRDELDDLIRVLQDGGGSKPFESYSRFAGLRTIARARDDIELKGYAIG